MNSTPNAERLGVVPEPDDQLGNAPLVYRITCQNQISSYFNVARLLWHLCGHDPLPASLPPVATYAETTPGAIASQNPSMLTFGGGASGENLRRLPSFCRTTGPWILFVDIGVNDSDDQFDLANAVLLVQNHHDDLKPANGRLCVRLALPSEKAVHRVDSLLWPVAERYPGSFQLLVTGTSSDQTGWREPRSPKSPPSESWPCQLVDAESQFKFGSVVRLLDSGVVQPHTFRLTRRAAQFKSQKGRLSHDLGTALEHWLQTTSHLDSGLGGMTYLGLIVLELLLRNSVPDLTRWVKSGSAVSADSDQASAVEGHPARSTAEAAEPPLAADWLDGVIHQARESSDALLEAINNIVHHSKNHRGVLLLRVLDSATAKAKDQRDRKILATVHPLTPTGPDSSRFVQDRQRFIVGTVLDYSADALSLSDTFIKELRDELGEGLRQHEDAAQQLLDGFECLTPQGVVHPDGASGEAFGNYRQDHDHPDRVGLHRGLQNARRRIERLGGHLTVESHSSPRLTELAAEKKWRTPPDDWYVSPPTLRHDGNPTPPTVATNSRIHTENRLPGTRLTVALRVMPELKTRPTMPAPRIPKDSTVAQTMDWRCNDATQEFLDAVVAAQPPADNAVIALADSLRHQIARFHNQGSASSEEYLFLIDAAHPGLTEYCQRYVKNPGELLAKAVSAALWSPDRSATRHVRAIGFYRCDDRFRRNFHSFMEDQIDWCPDPDTPLTHAFDCVLLPEPPAPDGQSADVAPADPEVDIYRLLTSESEPRAAAKPDYRWDRSGELTWGWSQHFGTGAAPTVRWQRDWPEIESVKAPHPYHLLFSYSSNEPSVYFPSGVAVTHFEHTLPAILNREITDQGLGCRHSQVHIRLGSTVHLDTFYEADQLFSIPRFVRDFAYLLVRKMLEVWGKLPSRLLAYGYATYSEGLLRQIKALVESLNVPNHTRYHVNHVVYERGEEDGRGDEGEGLRPPLVDSGFEANDAILLVVPIGTTLKTTLKMIGQLQSDITSAELKPIDVVSPTLICSTLIAVGVGTENNAKNPYWQAAPDRRMLTPPPDDGLIIPITGPLGAGEDTGFRVHYSVSTDAKYHYPFPPDPATPQCIMCFPAESPCDEWPLVETNRVSVAPMLTADPAPEGYSPPDSDNIKDTIAESLKSLSPLACHVRYPHFERDGHQYEYYFDTQDIAQSLTLSEALSQWKKEHTEEINSKRHHYIVVPSHHRAQAFLDRVVETVFAEIPVQVISLDVNTASRDSIKTRYSWITHELNERKRLANLGPNDDPMKLVCFHFVNDTITSGKTLLRARSLTQTLLPDSYRTTPHIFSYYYHVVQTRSDESWTALLGQAREDEAKGQLFDYVHVNIPHLHYRHGQCPWCAAHRTSESLMRQSVNPALVETFQHRVARADLHSLSAKPDPASPEWSKPGEPDVPAVAWRRLFCTHVAMTALKPFFGMPLTPGDTGPAHWPKAEQRILELLAFDVPSQIRPLNAPSPDAEGSGTDTNPHAAIANARALYGAMRRNEYLFSFIEALTRSPLTNHRVIRASMFRISIGMLHYLVTQDNTGLSPELCQMLNAMMEEHQAHKLACPGFGNQVDYCPLFHLVHLLLLRLEGLPSTYLFRPKYAFPVRKWINDSFVGTPRDRLRLYQMAAIKGVIHSTTDTSWSGWLDRELTSCLRWELGEPSIDGTYHGQFVIKPGRSDLPAVDSGFLWDLFVENNRVFYEAADHLEKTDDLWADQSGDLLAALGDGNEATLSKVGSTLRPRIAAMLRETNTSYDDYKLENVARCLQHMLCQDRAWSQESIDCAPAGIAADPEAGIQEAADLLLWPAASLHYLRVSFGASDKANTQSSNSAFKANLERLLQLFHRTLGQTSVQSVALGGFYDPPYDQALLPDSTLTPDVYVRIAEAATKYLAVRDDHDILARSSPRSQSGDAGLRWDIVSAPPPRQSDPYVASSDSYHGVVLQMTGSDTDQDVVSAPYVLTARYEVPATTAAYLDQNYTIPLSPWSEPSRLRLLLMLRHTLEDRVLGQTHRAVINQLIRDEWLAHVLTNSKATDHLSPQVAKDWAEILDSGLKKVSLTLVRQRNADKQTSDLFMSAIQGALRRNKTPYYLKAADLKKAIGPGIVRPRRKADRTPLPYDRACFGVILHYDALPDDAEIAVLGPADSSHAPDKPAKELGDLLLTVAANALRYGLRNAEGKVDVDIRVSETDPSLLAMSYPVDSDNRGDRNHRHDPDEARRQVEGHLSTKGEPSISLWTLGQYVHHVATQLADGPEAPWPIIPTTDQATTFTVLLPLVRPSRDSSEAGQRPSPDEG